MVHSHQRDTTPASEHEPRHRAAPPSAQDKGSSTIYDWSSFSAAPEAQLNAFDTSIGLLHDAVAVGNHAVWGDPLPAHLPGGAAQLSARLEAPETERGDERRDHGESPDTSDATIRQEGEADPANATHPPQLAPPQDYDDVAGQSERATQQKALEAQADALVVAIDAQDKHPTDVTDLEQARAVMVKARAHSEAMTAKANATKPDAMSLGVMAPGAGAPRYGVWAPGWSSPKKGAETKVDAARAKAPGAKTTTPPKSIELPSDISREAVLTTWIALYNEMLNEARSAGEKRTLIARGWANERGLDLALLERAAAAWRASNKAKNKADDGNEGPVTSVDVLEMIVAKGMPRVLSRKGKDKTKWNSKCLQFSEKVLENMGVSYAQRAGTKDDGPLTMAYRGQDIAALPKDLPPGCKVGVTSRPEWGFTQCGNHWFVSLGGGFFADQVLGVTTGEGMANSLNGTTADQWADRVVQGKVWGKKFVETHRQFERYFSAPAELKEEGKKAVIEFVKANKAVYRPRLWAVRPTSTTPAG